MMRRKLIQQGGGGFTLYLPKKWIEQHNVKKGDEVEVEQIDHNLIISTTPVNAKQETDIKITDLTESSIRTLLTNTYRKGFDRVRVHFDSDKHFEVAKEVIRTRLIGFDVTKKEKNYFIMENITEPAPEQFETILRKILFNISELVEITKKRLDDPASSNEYEEVEERIQKYDNFCRRVISKRSLVIRHSELVWVFLGLIVHGQRELYWLNKFVKTKIKVSKETEEMLTEMSKMVKMMNDAYVNKDLKLLEQMHPLEKELIFKKGYSCLQSKKGKEVVIIYHLMASIRNFYLASSPLVGMLL